MALRLKTVDRDTPMLLPPDLRDWIPSNHIVHFILDAVGHLPLQIYHLNWKGSGSRQYPPSMMLSLLIFSYVTGRFSSRRIEEATYSDVAVRYICGNTHPDHDTICTFRRKNTKAFKAAFVDVLQMAVEEKFLKKLGTVSIDGTKIKANASKHAAVSFQRAGEQLEILRDEVQQLMQKAEQADRADQPTGLDIPAEISRREERIKPLEKAREMILQRHREEEQKRLKKKTSLADLSEPPPKKQVNFTDPESRIMKAGNGKHFEQAYNAQAAVDTESMLIIGEHVTNAPNDKEQLIPTRASIPEESGYTAENVLADSGYYSEEAVKKAKSEHEVTVYASIGKQRHHTTVDELEAALKEPPPLSLNATAKEVMQSRLKSIHGRELYKLRKQTVEPVFGIIKSVIGFTHFSRRGLVAVQGEWDLVSLSYNMKRLFNLKTAGI